MDKIRHRDIDNAKGIAILLVMLGHSITLMDNPLNTIILSFHMPLFFFLSGAVVDTDLNYGAFIYKKVKKCGGALIFQGILSILVWFGIDVLWKKQSTFAECDLLYFFDNWFLISLFFAMLFSFWIIKVGIIASVPVLAGLFALFLTINTGTEAIWKYVEQTTLAIVFIVLGHHFVGLIRKNARFLKKYSIEILIVLVSILCGSAWYNGPCAMAANIYGNKILFFLTSIIGIVIVMLVSESIENRFLVFCGQNSLIIFTTHFSAQKVITAILRELHFYSYMDYPFYLFIWVLMIVNEVAICIFYKLIKNKFSKN